MSSRHLAWAIGLKTVKGTARHVLLQLAYWADSKTGHVTRSHQQLAEETGYSVRTVQDALKELTQPGCVFIERKRRTSRRGRLADSYKILAVLPSKTAGRRGDSQPAKSADRTGKICRAYTKEDSNTPHPASPQHVAASHVAPREPTSCSDSSRPPDGDCRQNANASRALWLASLPGSPSLGECQRRLSALDEEHGQPLVDKALRELRLQDGVKKPAGLLRAICKRLSDDARPVRSLWSDTSHGLTRF